MRRMAVSENNRGKGYQPKFARCKKCGELFWKETARRVYCDECRIVRQEERIEEQRIRARRYYEQNREKCKQKAREAKARKREGLLPPSKLPQVDEPAGGFEPHVCMVSRRCAYGLNFDNGCNYVTITGELRTSGGRSQIVNGRCDRFKPMGRGRRPGWLEEKTKKLERM